MKRWDFKNGDGVKLSLYYPDIEALIKRNPSAYQISENMDYSHEEFCGKIMSRSEYSQSCGGRTICKISAGNDIVFVKLYKDSSDGRFYDYCEYQIIKGNSYVFPCTYTMSTPKKFWELYVGVYSKGLKYEIISFRRYGEPRLKKPKELKGIASSGSAVFIPKKCNPQFYIKNDDVWIKHTDYFSPSYRKLEDVGTPLSYRLKKYEMSDKCAKDKFLYPDCWGSIVLRQEAWIRISNLVPFLKVHNASCTAMEIIRLMEECHSWNQDEISYEWNRFYEDLSKKVAEISAKDGE